MSQPPEDTVSLDEFTRRSAEYLAHMRESHQPITLTVNGQPEAVIQRAEDYRAFLDVIETQQAIEGIRRGLHSLNSSQGQPVAQAFSELEGKYPYLRRQ